MHVFGGTLSLPSTFILPMCDAKSIWGTSLAYIFLTPRVILPCVTSPEVRVVTVGNSISFKGQGSEVKGHLALCEVTWGHCQRSKVRGHLILPCVKSNWGHLALCEVDWGYCQRSMVKSQGSEVKGHLALCEVTWGYCERSMVRGQGSSHLALCEVQLRLGLSG